MGELYGTMGAVRMDRGRHAPKLPDHLVQRAVDLAIVKEFSAETVVAPPNCVSPTPPFAFCAW